jgi:NADH-quinone oxidoreductase subunit F
MSSSRHTLAAYRDLGGYAQWERILRERPDPADLIEEVKRSGCVGAAARAFRPG